MKIKIDLKFFAFLIIIFLFTNQIHIYVLTMGFCLIHEVGHLIIAMLLKFKPKELNIMPLGFFIRLDTKFEKKEKTKEEIKKILIYLAGPTTNIIIAVIFANLNIKHIEIIYINLIITIFNLIPIYPLDGGRILKSIIKITSGSRKANKYIHKISNLLVILLTMISSIAIVYFKNISILFVVVYLWYLTYYENKRFELKERIYNSLPFV